MKEKQRRKLMRDAAEEVCWGLAIVSQFPNISADDMMKMIGEDFLRWADLVDWDNYR